MTNDLLKQQLAYYRARAEEYDSTIFDTPSGAEPPAESLAFDALVHSVRSLPPVESILELACGTGIWTEALVQVGQRITAIDGSPEMIALNRAKVNDARVSYQVADLFEWEPQGEYDLVFFAFWISHVPPDQLAPFLKRVRRAVRPSGQVIMIDQPDTVKELYRSDDSIEEARTLTNGQTFTIVKVYYDPLQLKVRLEQAGFSSVTVDKQGHFFSLTAT